MTLSTLENYSSKGSTDSVTDIDMPIIQPFIDPKRVKYPCCIVWTPIPLLSWLMPIIGHMGIALSSGVIRDFAGPYFVSEDDMAFGTPTKYWQLDWAKSRGGVSGWDRAITEASNEYKKRMHNLCCDNCHSHVAMALNLMEYDGSSSWNMVKLALLMVVHGKYVSAWCWFKTWLPFIILVSVVVGVYVLVHYSEKDVL